MRPVRQRFRRSLRLFTILFVVGFIAFFAVNVKAQSIAVNSQQLTVNSQHHSGKTGIGNESRSPQAWENLARTSYAAGEFAEAAKYWRQAVAGFEVGGDWLNQAIALSNLSLTYQQLGRWEEANSAIGKSRSLLPQESRVKSLVELKAIGQILDIQSNGEWEQGQINLALQTGKQATNIYVKLKDNLGWKRSLIAQVKTLQELGLYQQACQAIIPVVESNNSENFVIPSQDCQQLITEKLVTIKRSVKTPSNPTLKNIQITGARLLGDVWRQLGYLKESQQLLEELERVVTQQEFPQEQALVLLSLGDTYQSLGNRNKFLSVSEDNNYKKDYENAINLYKKSINVTANNSFLKVQAQLNLLSLVVKRKSEFTGNAKEIQQLRLEILSQLSKLPRSHKLVYAEVSLMNSLVDLKKQLETPNNVSNSSNVNSEKILNYCLPNSAIVAESVLENIEFVSSGEVGRLGAKAIALARNLGDFRATAYALGNLGTVYEKNQQWLEAQQCTEQALLLSQNVQLNAPDLAYQWQWQLGRIRRNGEAKDVDGAIGAYTAAFNTLQSLRNDLVPISRDGQFDFRDKIEPVYREFVDLLLQGEKPSPENLKQARNVIEALQVAELDNFFRDGCVVVNKAEEIDAIADKYDPTAAVIHAIILPNRLAIILKLPGQSELEYHVTAVSEETIRNTLKKLGGYLEERGKNPDVIITAKQLYQWVFKPIELSIDKNLNVETLVFVLDRPLQKIPMTILHDGKQHLIQKKYDIVLAPGLQLTNAKERQDTRFKDIKLFAGGVDEKQLPIEDVEFEAIKNLKEEINGIDKVMPVKKRLLNSEFTIAKIRQLIALENYSIIHIKTHGQFSSQPEKTFLVAYRSFLRSKDLDNLVKTGSEGDRHTIELLVLSACQTAKGDDRATLGLAGLAVRSGARSTLSTLWKADDEATTKLMVHFYNELRKPGMKMARALHTAQKILIEQDGYKDARTWANYVLIGNWLPLISQ
ncbi:MAG: CHAT domain-containing protein [Tychonema bourrellyi B0820]|uniref:CHAT domain-containing protein n=1 Tax=Tychonema bourrellyi TaxID=54313 RepID=UPI0015D4B994|nr:CHAT domain-containing protein [Tychonema bourrellyi]MDQ2100000.1 CHAT domain-containing protein [Tychonema bourrellyi B0820]